VQYHQVTVNAERNASEYAATQIKESADALHTHAKFLNVSLRTPWRHKNYFNAKSVIKPTQS
jgi:hypothetical protein